ncbi:sugar kinase [Tenggerimyces flavus]|uniref:Sugar kinase n=1 Tax=Tenggerimyces flavus TaxID=1708749 RepID=A0ABV7Y675_9ACTN|nr:sugar kinase [Tenggerimyces flavus]MBM7785168.1 2-dehydro-3-deoxygluconokinase [Tenggerimyces flavus]
MADVVTLGETMALVAATGTGPFAVGSPARISFAGAESNVAIGLARLGHAAAWVGRLGDDPLGRVVVDGLRGEGVEVSGVRLETSAPTGLILREHRTADRVRVSYYRKGLAGSLLAPEDVPASAVREARVLHVTGITPALSESCRSAVRHAVSVAREAGVRVSLDLNYRASLWSRTSAAAELAELVKLSDVVFAGVDEAALVVSGGFNEQVAEQLASLGPREVVLKLAAEGAMSYVDGSATTAPGLSVTSVDPVGAGDAFVAGYLSALLDELPPLDRLRRGNACGAFAVSVAGDWEGLPRRDELATLASSDNVGR